MSDETWKEELREVFARFDADHSGRIDKSEFNELLDALGSSMSAKDREIGFALIDEDEDGSITFDEMADWWGIVREEAQS